MQNDLSKLPAPPTGQQGMTLGQFQHLPPPPQGQQGFTLNQVQNQGDKSSQLPILSKPQGGFGTALKDEAVGAGKSLLGGAIGVASGLQKFGKGIFNFFGADTSKMGLNALDSSTPEGQGVQDSLAYKSQGEQFGGALSDTAQIISPFAGGNLEALAAKGGSLASKATGIFKAGGEDATKLAETLAPKPTAKEVKLAQAQGRIYPGKEPTLFKGGTSDKIATSDKTFNATRTVQEQIPNATKMKPAELYNAVDEGITKKATALRPQMEATPIKPETVQKINTDWEALKKNQLADAPATEEPNVAKRQAKFESLLQKSGSSSHADLWDTRINYDNSISDAVKKANINSSESLQLQKEEWLQNRKILSDAINDTNLGMGGTSQKAFSDMSNLYEAKNNLLSKAEIKTANPSKIKQWLKDNPKKATALGTALGVEGLRALGLNYKDLLP